MHFVHSPAGFTACLQHKRTLSPTLAVTPSQVESRALQALLDLDYSKFRSSLQLAGFVSQATMLYKCLFDISTRFGPLEPSSTECLCFESIRSVHSYSLSFPLHNGLPNCYACILKLIVPHFASIAHDSPVERRPQ